MMPCSYLSRRSVSLGTDSTLPNHNLAIFPVSLQALKKLTRPLMQTQNPDNSNMSFMFNNNTYSDFRTAYKHVLIPSYVIQWFNKTKMSQNYTLIACLANTGQDQHLKLSPQRHVLQVFFLTRNIVSSPPDKYLW